MKLARAAVLALATTAPQAALAQDTNACPVDGCVVTISDITAEGSELAVTFESNFAPDMSKNHIHVWWGELYTIEQVSNNAEPTYGVDQGDWHPTADYPSYVTTGAASLEARGEAITLCVTAADRNHDILDPAVSDCREITDLIN